MFNDIDNRNAIIENRRSQELSLFVNIWKWTPNQEASRTKIVHKCREVGRQEKCLPFAVGPSACWSVCVRACVPLCLLVCLSVCPSVCPVCLLFRLACLLFFFKHWWSALSLFSPGQVVSHSQPRRTPSFMCQARPLPVHAQPKTGAPKPCFRP